MNGGLNNGLVLLVGSAAVWVYYLSANQGRLILMEITIQPLGALIGVAVVGLFSGLGFALGGLLITYYIEPRIKKWRREHKKVFSALQNSHKDKSEEKK